MEGKTYTEITLRHPEGKDLKAIKEKEGAKQSIEMIACHSGLSYNGIKELDICDFLNIKDIYRPLIKEVFKKLNKMNAPIKSITDECIFTDRKPKKHQSNLYTDTFEKEFMTTANAKVETRSTYEPITVHNTYIKRAHMNFTQCSFLVQNSPSNQVYLSNQRALTSHKN